MALSQPEKRSALQRAADFLFGYDYFISYSWSDGRRYAVALSQELSSRGFECFLDSSSYAKGENWRVAGRRAIQKTSRLILVGSPAAFESEPVLREAEAFASTGRMIVPIDFGGTLFPQERSAELFRHLPTEILAIKEAPGRLATGPSPEAVNELSSGFDLQRQAKKRLRWLSATAVVLCALLIASLAAGVAFLRQLAVAERNLAVAVGNEASRMAQQNRWLATRALLTEAQKYPVVFESYAAALGANASWLAFEEEVDLGAAGVEWLVASRTGRVAGGAAVDGSVFFLLPDGLTRAPTPIATSSRAVAFAEDETSLWFAAEDNGLLRFSVGASGPTLLDTPLARPSRVLSRSAQGQLLVGEAGTGFVQILIPGIAESGIVASGVHEMLFNDVSASEDAGTLAFTDYNLNLHIWQDGRSLHTLAPVDPAAAESGLPHPAVDVSRDGSLVGTVTDLGDAATLSVVEAESGRILWQRALPPTSVVSDRPIQFSPDASRIFVRHDLGIAAFSVSDGSDAWAPLDRPRPASALAIDPRSRFAAAAFSSPSIDLLDITDGSLLERVDGHRGDVTALTFSPDGKILLSGSSGGTMRRWSVQTNVGPRYVFGSKGFVRDAAFGPGGRLAVSFFYEGGHLAASVENTLGTDEVTVTPALLSISPFAHLTWSTDGRRLFGVTSVGDVLSWTYGEGLVAEAIARPAQGPRGRAQALIARPNQSGFFLLWDEKLDLYSEEGHWEASFHLPESWQLRYGQSPLAVETNRFVFMISDPDGVRIAEWSSSHGFRAGPVLDPEPSYFFLRNGRTILVGPSFIKSWRPPSKELRTEARLATPIPHGGPGLLMADRTLLIRPGGTSNRRSLQLELELIDLETGRQQAIVDSLSQELAEDSENFILEIGEGPERGTVLTLCRSSLLLNWGIALDPGAQGIQESTGLSVEGTSVRPAEIEHPEMNDHEP